MNDVDKLRVLLNEKQRVRQALEFQLNEKQRVRQALEFQLNEKQRVRRALEIQQTRFGSYAPPHLALDIEDIEQGIRVLQNDIEARGCEIESLNRQIEACDREIEALKHEIETARQIIGVPENKPADPNVGESPADNLDRRRFHFMWHWVSGTILGWLTVGLGVGWCQGRALATLLGKKREDLRPFWLLLTTLSAPLIVCATFGAIFWNGGIDETTSFVGGISGGVVIGTAQWLDLHRTTVRPKLLRWLLVNALAGGIAEMTIDNVWKSMHPSLDLPTLEVGLTVAVVATIFSVITGLMLLGQARGSRDMA